MSSLQVQHLENLICRKQQEQQHLLFSVCIILPIFKNKEAISCWFSMFKQGVLFTKVIGRQLCTNYAISHKQCKGIVWIDQCYYHCYHVHTLRDCTWEGKRIKMVEEKYLYQANFEINEILVICCPLYLTPSPFESILLSNKKYNFFNHFLFWRSCIFKFRNLYVYFLSMNSHYHRSS